MTEAKWLSCTIPGLLLAESRLHLPRRARIRKWRLVICCCCRQIEAVMADPAGRRAVEVAELYADGQATPSERDDARRALETVFSPPDGPVSPQMARLAACAGVRTGDLMRGMEVATSALTGERTRARLGPFQVQLAPQWKKVRAEEFGAVCDLLRDLFGNPFRPAALDPAHHNPEMLSLAHAAYEERELPSGHLDPLRLGVLADALEEAGCGDAELLGHLREPGPHVRGCWPLDLLLAKG
jgi:hypothetical protein